MSESERVKEYRKKISSARKEYQSEFDAFMERRRSYRMLDEGVREENEIRSRFYAKLDTIAEEYRDVVDAIRHEEKPRSGSESGEKRGEMNERRTAASPEGN